MIRVVYRLTVAILMLTVLISPSVHAKGIYAEVAVSAEAIPFDETVTVSLSLPDGVTVPPEQLVDALLQGQDERAFVVVDIYADAEMNTVHCVLEPWIPGQHAVTFGTLVAGDPNAPVHIVTGVAYVTVEAPVADVSYLSAPRLLPIPGRPLLGVEPATWQRLADGADHDTDQAQRHLDAFAERQFPWSLLAAISFIVLCLGIIRRYGRPILNRLRHTEGYAESPQHRANQALERLVSEDLPAQQRFDSFYVALTAIVRRYIEDSFGLKAPESTTEEFLREASESKSFDEGAQVHLGEFLSYADLVKFAKVNPSTAECSEAVDSARTLINGQQ